ncbi:hypothetical protein QM042_01825 [Escherichia coli]
MAASDALVDATDADSAAASFAALGFALDFLAKVALSLAALCEDTAADAL